MHRQESGHCGRNTGTSQRPTGRYFIDTLDNIRDDKTGENPSQGLPESSRVSEMNVPNGWSLKKFDSIESTNGLLLETEGERIFA